MRWLNQVVQITLINLSNLPQRIGTSLVVVIGIAGVVGVLVSVLAMAEGFRHTLSSTGRPDRVIMLRAGSDSELSSGVPREQAALLAALPGVRRDDRGRPLPSRATPGSAASSVAWSRSTPLDSSASEPARSMMTRSPRPVLASV